MVFFTIAVFRDPGYLSNNTNVPFLKLVEKFDPNILCPTCEILCDKESRHCYICNKCVDRWDHHCQWINNCVGSRNHSFFFLYIIALAVYMTLTTLMCLLNLTFDITAENLVKAREHAFLPVMVHDNVTAANWTFTLSIVVTLVNCMFFLPCLFLLVYI